MSNKKVLYFLTTKKESIPMSFSSKDIGTDSCPRFHPICILCQNTTFLKPYSRVPFHHRLLSSFHLPGLASNSAQDVLFPFLACILLQMIHNFKYFCKKNVKLHVQKSDKKDQEVPLALGRAFSGVPGCRAFSQRVYPFLATNAEIHCIIFWDF